MYQQSYAEILADSATDAREQERLALDHAVTLLERAVGTPAGSPEEARAMDFTTQLWSVFIKDLADACNGLPDLMRAHLMSIGLGVMAEIKRIQARESHDIAAVAEICAIVRDGLV
jgi:flagellar protein FlaF